MMLPRCSWVDRTYYLQYLLHKHGLEHCIFQDSILIETEEEQKIYEMIQDEVEKKYPTTNSPNLLAYPEAQISVK